MTEVSYFPSHSPQHSLLPAESFFPILQNKHLIFLGDSLTRYQYLNLLYLLTERNYLNNYVEPNVVNEHSYSNWTQFYLSTNSLFAPYEYCDCYRNPDVHDERYEFENRYYFNPVLNLSITYVMFTGRYDNIKGHWYDVGDYNQFRQPSTQYYKEFWSGFLIEKLDWLNTLSPFKYSVVVLNAGYHPHHFNNENFVLKLLGKMKSTFTQVIWKTTTYNSAHELPAQHDTFICNLPSEYISSCLNLSITQYFNESMYWDDKHFYADAYNIFNSMLVKLIESLDSK